VDQQLSQRRLLRQQISTHQQFGTQAMVTQHTIHEAVPLLQQLISKTAKEFNACRLMMEEITGVSTG
jgi:hypothetical protein